MKRSVQLIRLVASVVLALAACFFVVVYDRTSTIRYPFDHPDADAYTTESGETVLCSRPVAGEFITAYCEYAYAVPLAALMLGVLVIWRWPEFHALIELIVSAMWVLGLIWVGFVLIMWQFQNIPLFHGMRLHY
jgi:hypothetical protein